MMAGSSFQVERPMSISEITKRAEDYVFSDTIPPKYWLRTGETLLREAQIYEREQNDQQAYMLLMRYTNLIAERLPKHPAYKQLENRAGVKAAIKTLREVMVTMEVLKPRIDARYNAYMEKNKHRSVAVDNDGSRASTWANFAASDPAVAGNTTTLDAEENSQLAVMIAHKEIRRRDAARRSVRQAGVSAKEEQQRRTAGLWDGWDAGLSRDGASASRDDDEMRRNMEASRRRMDGSHDVLRDTGLRRQGEPRPTPARNGTSEYHYPSITRSQPIRYEDNFESRSRSISPARSLPPKPPKERFSEVYEPEPPPRPLPKERLGEAYEPEPPPRPGKETLDPIEASMSDPKATFTFRPSAYLENGNPLRTIFLPPTVRTEFLKYAESNTRRNLETCGMLCGTVISNAIFIQQVVIPEQENTSDTCEMINESAFFDYVDSQENAMVLGWIHTHPTQTCFMSSRDLHTHCAYQIMIPESIAIVCAPSKNPSWGVFRLTDPPGMQCVRACTKPGIFHPHEETNIYTDALRPGHVFEAKGLEFTIVDLRPDS
ncbi:endosome-associated ubiquitin isopeptidase-like protein [Stipitochalara longipes BDJ]|nr:endosome-associated ubiquitin isopeptidase-like protein [Stipitochalara longipes BDJ]